MKVLGIIAALIASVTAHPALPHPHPASYHAAPGPYHPVPYHPAPPVYHPAPAPYKPAPAPYKPAPPPPYKPAHPAPYVEYPDEPVILCPNYPYCDEAPYGLSHLQYEIDALRKRTALVIYFFENIFKVYSTIDTTTSILSIFSYFFFR